MNEFLIKLIANGGKGSGNHNPGQGRGVGKPAKGTSKFSKGQEVEFEYGGGKGTGKIVRKLTDKEKKDRAFLANPDAGDYYEVEKEDGYKTIVWDAKIKEKSKKDSVGPAKIAKKDVQKLLQPAHDRYTREVVDIKYNPDKDYYEAKAIVKFKDGTPDLEESWSTKPGKDPKEELSWFVDNGPTFLEELQEKLDRVHGKK